MRATAIGRSQAMIFRFLFWEAEQQQGRLRLENANRREAKASRRAIGRREGIGTGWSFSTFGGWGQETPGRRVARPRRTSVREKR